MTQQRKPLLALHVNKQHRNWQIKRFDTPRIFMDKRSATFLDVNRLQPIPHLDPADCSCQVQLYPAANQNGQVVEVPASPMRRNRFPSNQNCIKQTKINVIFKKHLETQKTVTFHARAPYTVRKLNSHVRLRGRRNGGYSVKSFPFQCCRTATRGPGIQFATERGKSQT